MVLGLCFSGRVLGWVLSFSMQVCTQSFVFDKLSFLPSAALDAPESVTFLVQLLWSK